VRAFLQWVFVCASAIFAVAAVVTSLPSHYVMAGSKAKARGAELFATRGCSHCHGPQGVGGAEGPDLQLVRNRLKADQIMRQIHDGGKGMPAYGDQLSADQMSDLVAYLRAKRKVIVMLQKSPEQLPGAVPDPE
jgi:mono/diheme cytochrome c family protein